MIRTCTTYLIKINTLIEPAFIFTLSHRRALQLCYVEQVDHKPTNCNHSLSSTVLGQTVFENVISCDTVFTNCSVAEEWHSAAVRGHILIDHAMLCRACPTFSPLLKLL